MTSPALFWFRRDLRLKDNCGLFHAMQQGNGVIPIYIFEKNPRDLAFENAKQHEFLQRALSHLDHAIKSKGGSGLWILEGNPTEVWTSIQNQFPESPLYFNKEYEPNLIHRDEQVQALFPSSCFTFKDHLIWEPGEILKKDQTPYTVFTPFYRRWLEQTQGQGFPSYSDKDFRFWKEPSPTGFSFASSPAGLPRFQGINAIPEYSDKRDVLAEETSGLGPHLRFGTESIRDWVRQGFKMNEGFARALAWRDFFAHILFHFPHVEQGPFKAKYAHINWENDSEKFEKWCNGETGFHMVDAGMKELTSTGNMHNRARMICASFLVKNLRVDWRWGEQFFAKHLLDYDLASNNGNWQWAAGTGCDASPYFRVFNPDTQLKKFDPEAIYIQRWLNLEKRPQPMVDLKKSRLQAIELYKEALSGI